MAEPYSITTPIYYVNAEPHIGHTYTTVVADTLARYHRMRGQETWFLTGTDEHGEKVEEAAASHGEDAATFAERISGIFRDTWSELGFTHDRFIRTTDPDHVRSVREMLQRVWDAGQVDFREYEGLYCVGCERFLTERDMVDGLCRDHERAPEPRTESNYFFRMTEHFEWLSETIRGNPEYIRPERYRNEVLAMIREETTLGDLCISRPKSRLEWGVELPFDSNYVCYVWFDALVNYLTGLGFPDDPAFEARWAGVEHMIGKDILKPHGVFWPTMLRAAGLPQFRHLSVHGYWNVDDRKVSKSLGNMIAPLSMREKYGFEPFRYFLLREMAFGQDANFSEAALVTRANADLANNLGNLVSRTLNMTARYCDGTVPAPGETGTAEAEVAAAVASAGDALVETMDRLEPHRALEAVFRAVDATNRYLDANAPWTAAKEGRGDDVRRTLYTSCQALRGLGLLLFPFVPDAARELLDRIGSAGELETARLPDAARAWDALPPGTPTRKGDALFPRAELPTEDDA